MTVDLLLDRLERFRRGLLMYRDWCNLNVPHPRNGSDVIPLGDLDALREKLRQEFSLLDEYVAAFSQGRYQIHLDTKDEHDMYVQALSEKCEDWHIDIIEGSRIHAE